jgi:transposase
MEKMKALVDEAMREGALGLSCALLVPSNTNAQRMSEFLAQVSQAHASEFIIMVVDGASSHKSHDLAVPDNIRLLPFPSYSPELNPQEHVWDELREKEFPNRVFDSLQAVIEQLEAGLPRMAANTQGL